MNDSVSLSTTVLIQHKKNQDDTVNDIDLNENIENDIESSASNKRIHLKYILFQFVEDIDVQAKLLEIESTGFVAIGARWRLKKTNLTLRGQAYFFNCWGGINCNRKLQLKIDLTNNSGSILVSEHEGYGIDDHDHDEEEKLNRNGIQEIVKLRIQEYEKMHLKVKIYEVKK